MIFLNFPRQKTLISMYSLSKWDCWNLCLCSHFHSPAFSACQLIHIIMNHNGIASSQPIYRLWGVPRTKAWLSKGENPLNTVIGKTIDTEPTLLSWQSGIGLFLLLGKKHSVSLCLLNWGDRSLKLSWATGRIEPACEGSRAKEWRDQLLNCALPDIHLYLQEKGKIIT